ncbi:MAG TPA: ORF6N domain-containing protein [Pyrinomonadaceae bacterium]|nr:ORF6N domain-containing protein [Pyrinomonadaceae bacterium]
MNRTKSSLPLRQIQSRIFMVRGINVMSSSDLAQLYGVEPKVLNQAVKRNSARFPPDFMFQLTQAEFDSLKSQFVTSSWGRPRRALPYAFTEHGILMLSCVLRSHRAIQVNIEIMRAFVSMREMMRSNEELARKLLSLEKRYDGQFLIVFRALRKLLNPKPVSPNRIGFRSTKSKI